FWPQWRGPLGSGVAPLADPPVTWSETNHLKWKAKVPGSGTSTPVIWGDRVFLLSAIPTGKKAEVKAPQVAASNGNSNPSAGARKGSGMETRQPDELYQFVVLCFDRQTGKALWQKTVREQAPHEGHHPDHGFASGSPVTDGRHLFAFFGSRGLHCLDLEGNLKWSKDFGQMQTRNSFGEGSSPALYRDTVVINWDDETENDFIVALDKRTGKELWRTPRQEPTGWSTPLIVDFDGKAQVVVNATTKACSYDLATGKELWRCGGQTANAIPSPVASADTVYLTSGFRGSALYAIALGRTGNLTGTDAIRWSYKKHTPYVPSPLLVDDFLYFAAINNGVLSCVDAKTGTPHFEGERLEGINGVYASPVAAKDRVYVLGRDGTCLVLKQGPKLEVLARNKLEDKTDASPAAVGHELFVRGHQYLYCLTEKQSE
ncbi:MAG TPA: PQQ-binding-like beta-propeller repeat protein, partial [Bacillota bacterium]|nr:PQQ-binding-like beta-propeller repeat protein [Bacillota bacterium]